MTYLTATRFKIFGLRPLSDMLDEVLRKARKHIINEDENYILNVNEIEYINYLTSLYTIEPPVIDFDNLYVSTYEKQIPAEHFPRSFDVRGGHTYPKQVIVYHLPFTGDTDLLQCRPSSSLMLIPEVFIIENDICFEVLSWNDDSDEIKQNAENNVSAIRSQLENLCKEILEYNNALKLRIEQLFKMRKQKFLEKNNLLASLNIPIKKRSDLPKTYSVPVPMTRKSVLKKPKVNEKGFTPEPTMDESVYREILSIIDDVGKMFERLPSTYTNKQEEDLRDHLLLQLEPRFEGSSTGETFNKSGRTDILIRHQGSNIFIAECKFWKGKKKYVQTITQLLRYLTWRDSKAAVIIFVRNKDFSSVLQIVEGSTSGHPNYLGFINKDNETWFNYRFHINDDINREVKLAVLLFHIPRGG